MLIIAEIGQSHEGSLGIAHSYIDALSSTGIDAIKFQTHIAEAESSEFEQFRVKFSYEDKSRFDYWKRMEFKLSEWEGLKQHCSDIGMEFISSPFSNAAVDLLEKIGVRRYKIGSGEVNNTLMLSKIAKTGKPIILSSGMSSYIELDKSVYLLRAMGVDISILQCTTAYPTLPEEWGLNVIGELKERYNVTVGFSDHSGDTNALIAATALGAEILEFHAVFDQKMFGPDAKASLTIDEIKQLVKGVREVNESIHNPIDKSDNSKFGELKSIFEKTLTVNRNLASGTIISEDMLDTKKPRGYGIDAGEYKSVLGKKIIVDKVKWDFLAESDIE